MEIYVLATLAFQLAHDAAPSYISADMRCVADMPGRRHIRAASTMELFVPEFGRRPLAHGLSRSWPPESVTVCM